MCSLIFKESKLMWRIKNVADSHVKGILVTFSDSEGIVLQTEEYIN
jgi:hypothetical protein